MAVIDAQGLYLTLKAGDDRIGCEQQEANARLIAAAPDLLAAAERVLAKLDHPTHCVTALDADALRDAIAKATE